ncbi:ADP-heptose:LPS heptosyl transferase I [compost metagenome]
MDTGLTHLAAALKVPTIGIYCATDPAATGLHGCPRAVNLGGIGAPPSVDDVIAMLGQLGGVL